MSLEDVFHNAAKKIFKVFKSLQRDVTFVEVINNGFEKTETEYPLKAIVDTFSYEDVQTVPFRSRLQPDDEKFLFLGREFPVQTVNTDDLIIHDGRVYTIVGWVSDPAKALYTIAGRKGGTR